MKNFVLASALSIVFVSTAVNAQQVNSNLTFSGDFRYRHDIEQQENARNNYDLRNRERIRMRFSVMGKLSESIEANFRLASGDGSPVSTNQTLTDSFSGKGIYIDRAYVQWKPQCARGAAILGGKIKNPFVTVAENEIIWDNDLSPEGVAVQYSGGEKLSGFFVNLSYMPLEERATEVDGVLLGGQAGIERDVPNGKIILGISYYDYQNTKHKALLYESARGFGNSIDGDGNYMFDYNEFEIFGEYSMASIPMKPSIYADYVTNIADDVGDNTAWIAGIGLGEAKNPGSYSFRCSYRNVEKDAVIGAFADSDFRGGGTDGSGYELNFDYQASPKAKISLTYYLNRKNLDNEKDYQRLMIDFNFKL